MNEIGIMNLFIAHKRCEKGKVACPKTGRCISRNWLCDGENDCGDNWDEDTYHCTQNPTTTTQRPTRKCSL